MTDVFEGVTPMVHESYINVPYHWWAGETAGKFFVSLRDEEKILGRKCNACGKVFSPPRKMCPDCYIETHEWVELGPEGELVSFTVARRKLASIPKDRETPVVFGLVKLDGATTSMLHFIDGAAPENVRIGMRVKAVFAKERSATIKDISHFEPV